MIKAFIKQVPVMVILMLASCSKPAEQQSETVKTNIPEDISEAPTDVPVVNSITGVVTEVQPGKDGYTANVKTTRQENVFVTVSRVNLKDPGQYRSVNVGDTVQVIGEEWEMNGETHLKALELK